LYFKVSGGERESFIILYQKKTLQSLYTLKKMNDQATVAKGQEQSSLSLGTQTRTVTQTQLVRGIQPKSAVKTSIPQRGPGGNMDEIYNF
jgi:hypothetical protein